MNLSRLFAIPATCAIIAVSGLSMAACSSSSGSVGSENTTAAKSGKIEITDVDGKSYSFDKPLEKVVIQWSGSGGPFMTMSGLLGEDVYKYIAGMDNGLADYRADMWSTYKAAIPELENVPKIGNVGEDFDTEAVLASDVDAAIFPIGLKESAQEIQAKLEAAGIPVIYTDYHDETRENHIKTAEILGKLFGKEDRAKEMIDFYTEHRDKVESKVQELLKTKDRPSMYIEVGMGGPAEYGNSYSNDYMWGGIAYDSGATCIGDGVIETASAIDPEYLLEANPEKIVFTGSYWPKESTSIRMGFEADEGQTKKLVEAYFDRNGWSALDAVKNKDIHVIHHGIGRELYDCVCYEYFAKVCFPDEFKDLDPTASLKEWYEKFLPYEFSGLWFYDYK